MKSNVVIGLNGKLKGKNDEYIELLNRLDPMFIAADGGAFLFEKIDIKPDLIIGDLDSLKRSDIKEFSNANIEIVKYPVEKNETDGELAIDYCLDKNFDKIILTFAMGGRFDQQFANIFLLEYAHDNNVSAVIREPGLEIGLVDGEKIFLDKKDWGLSLLPLDRKVEGVDIIGCKYLLNSFTLRRDRTRGISNLITKNKARVTNVKGELLYILNKHMQTS